MAKQQLRDARNVRYITNYLRNRELRQDVRNSLLNATLAELRAEFTVSVQRSDWLRAECITEIIVEGA